MSESWEVRQLPVRSRSCSFAPSPTLQPQHVFSPGPDQSCYVPVCRCRLSLARGYNLQVSHESSTRITLLRLLLISVSFKWFRCTDLFSLVSSLRASRLDSHLLSGWTDRYNARQVLVNTFQGPSTCFVLYLKINIRQLKLLFRILLFYNQLFCIDDISNGDYEDSIINLDQWWFYCLARSLESINKTGERWSVYRWPVFPLITANGHAHTAQTAD